MQSQKATQTQVDAAYRRAGELLHRGTPPQGVEKILMRRGFTEEAAQAIIADALTVLGLQDAPGLRLTRKAWRLLYLTIALAFAGAIALIVGSEAGDRPGGGLPSKVSDASLLVLGGGVLLAGAGFANLFTLVTALRARRRIRQPALNVVVVLALLGVAATVWGVRELVLLIGAP